MRRLIKKFLRWALQPDHETFTYRRSVNYKAERELTDAEKQQLDRVFNQMDATFKEAEKLFDSVSGGSR